MRLPAIKYYEPIEQRSIINFKGYNNNPVVEEGELTDMLNLSSSMSPCITQRDPRELIATLTSPKGLGSKAKRYYVDGTSFYYDAVSKGTVTASEKCFVNIGDYIIIFPDKKYYNTYSAVFGSLENTNTAAAGAITFTANTIVTSGADFSGFVAGDGVTISGCSVAANNKTAIIRTVAAKTLTFSDNTFTASTAADTIVITRAVPDIDYACEHENRLWGVKGNDIYASKLGDPLNFNVFDGLVTDSYATSVGSDGNFTACVSYSGHVLMFKENYIHQMFNNKPTNFHLTSTANLGVQSGCSKSAVIVNEILYYKSYTGFMAYGGGVPQCVSEKFGSSKYSAVVAGTDGRKYYASVYDGSAYKLFVLDTWKSMWHIEDAFHAIEFTRFENFLYGLSSTGAIYKFNSGTEVISWEAITEEFTETIHEKKGYSKITLKAELETGSTLNVYTRVDGGTWTLNRTFNTTLKRVFTVIIQPQRADYFQIKLTGSGTSKVFSLVRKFYYGSDESWPHY